MQQEVHCSEIWGGIRNQDVDVSSPHVTASLHSSACAGGRGGDIYYVGVCDFDHVTRIAVADVLGHGAAVSLVSEWLYESLRRRINELAGSAVLADLNDLAVERGLEALTTAAVVTVYRDGGQANFAYAGHHPAKLRRTGRAAWEEVTLEPEGHGRANLPLGVTRAVRYAARTVPIAAGDRLVLYTDGVLDTPGPDGGMFGRERLDAVLAAAGQAGLPELKTAVLRELRRYAGGALRHDDVTLLALDVR